MNRLKAILSEAEPELAYNMGGRNEESQRKLIANLGSYRRQLTLTFAALFALLFGLIVFGTYVIWIFTTNSSAGHISTLAKSLGIGGGSAAMVEVLRRVWSEWARVSLILTLLDTGTPELVAAIVSSLISKLD